MFRLARPFMRRVRTSLCFRCRRVRHLLVEDAVARLFVDLMEADLLARGCRWKQRNGTRDERQLEVAFPVSTTGHNLTPTQLCIESGDRFCGVNARLAKKGSSRYVLITECAPAGTCSVLPSHSR
jgi:hypothetical protein